MDTVPAVDSAAFEQLLEAMPDGVVIVGQDGRIVLVNGRTESLSGYSRQELVGMPVEELVPEGLRVQHTRHRAAYQRAPAVRAMGSQLDIRLRRRDGTEFPADVALSPIESEHGPLVVVSVRDITERRLAEAELLRAQERFRLVVEGIRDYAIFLLDPEGRVQSWSPAAERLEGYAAEEIVGRHFSVFYPQADRDAGRPARELAEATAKERYEEEGWRVRRDGSRFWASVVITALRDEAGDLTGFAKIRRDVTWRKRQDDRIRAVLEIAQATLEGRDEQWLLRLVAERAHGLLEANLGLVALADAEGDSLIVAAADGPRADAIRGSRLDARGSLVAEALASGQPTLIADASREPGGSEPVLEAAAAGPVLLVRLATADRAFGGLAVANEPGGRLFTESDRQLLELFAAQAAVAVDYLRVRDELQRLAVLEDRERIGRELHDGAIQALFAVGMSLQGMAMMTSDRVLHDRLEGAVAQIDEVIRDLRNYIFGLRPGLAADRHLGRAVHELAAQLGQQHGVACAVDVDAAVAARLSGRAADLVQVTREALSNVGRHAEATTCRVSLRAEPGFAVLEVEDDGRGFELGTGDGEGWGLRNLRERADALGGSLEVLSVPGEGTTVRLRVPY